MSRFPLLPFLLLLSLLAACEQAPRQLRAVEAVAQLRPLEGRAAQGTIEFRQRGDGVALAGEMTGLRGRTHVYRLHQFGDCSDPRGRSAGPEQRFRSALSEAVVPGTMLETSSDETGEVSLVGTMEAAMLSGAQSIIGRSVVVHRVERSERGDRSETRVACGVIGIVREELR